MDEIKRDTTRVVFHTRAELHLPSGIIEGEVTDLSLKGMFLTTHAGLDERSSPEYPKAGSRVSITIHLSGTGSRISFDLTGDIVRVDETGLAIKFAEMEFDSFLHLRNIVAYNTGKAEEIMEEFYQTVRKI